MTVETNADLLDAMDYLHVAKNLVYLISMGTGRQNNDAEKAIAAACDEVVSRIMSAIELIDMAQSKKT